MKIVSFNSIMQYNALNPRQMIGGDLNSVFKNVFTLKNKNNIRYNSIHSIICIFNSIIFILFSAKGWRGKGLGVSDKNTSFVFIPTTFYNVN